MDNYVIWGVDPGNSGAICRITENELPQIFPMPTKEDATIKKGKKKKKTSYDIEAIYQMLLPYKEDNNIVFIEKVASMVGEGSVSSFNFGMGFGILRGIFTGMFAQEPLLVTPTKWKKYFNQYTNDSEVLEIKNKILEQKEELKQLNMAHEKRESNFKQQLNGASSHKKKQFKSLIQSEKKDFSNNVTVIKKEITTLNRKKKSRSKDISRELARDLYPELAHLFKLKKSDGLAEALLIGIYGRDNLEKITE